MTPPSMRQTMSAWRAPSVQWRACATSSSTITVSPPGRRGGHLAGTRALTQLRLACWDVTDAAVAAICARVTSLRALALQSDARLTDASLAAIGTSQPHLMQLVVPAWSGMTQAGLRQLQAALGLRAAHGGVPGGGAPQQGRRPTTKSAPTSSWTAGCAKRGCDGGESRVLGCWHRCWRLVRCCHEKLQHAEHGLTQSTSARSQRQVKQRAAQCDRRLSSKCGRKAAVSNTRQTCACTHEHTRPPQASRITPPPASARAGW